VVEAATLARSGRDRASADEPDGWAPRVIDPIRDAPRRGSA